MTLRSVLCRLFKHRIETPALDQAGELQCLRCKKVLSVIPAEPEETGPLWDASYTNGCRNKTRFASYQQATARMDRMKKRPATLHVYACFHCRGFHLGNYKTGKRRKA